MLGVGNHLGQQVPAPTTLPYLPPYPTPINISVTPENTRYDPWPEGWGHAPEPIDNQTLRILMKNPDGIRPKQSDNCEKLEGGLKDMFDLQAGIILINEHNADTKQIDVREGYRHKLLKHWPTNRTEYSCSKTPAINTYLPGGTLITILNNWTGRILTTEVDSTKMGRWSCVNLRGKQEKIVSVYSTYRIPHDTLP